LLIVLPLTSKDKHQPLHVAVVPPEGGVTTPSFIKCDDIRSVSKLRLKRVLGRVGPETMESVEETLRILLGL
jgi:mRNA interferase MazF